MIKLLPLINSPVLVIQGENDSYGTEKQYNTRISEVSGEKELSVIPDCGHSPHAYNKTTVYNQSDSKVHRKVFVNCPQNFTSLLNTERNGE